MPLVLSMEPATEPVKLMDSVSNPYKGRRVLLEEHTGKFVIVYEQKLNVRQILIIK